MGKLKRTGKGQGRIAGLFARLREKNSKALITFVTAGDPDLATTGDIVEQLEKSGADLIELGIPFSDPMADGPTIQASSERAIEAGANLNGVLELVAKIRKNSDIPILLFGYYNPIFAYGVERFAKKARIVGADGVLIVDLPPEESGELKTELDNNGLDLIFLLTPTSDDSRMALVAKQASGFIYYVSLTGVTGARSSVSGAVSGAVKRIRRFTDLPIAVGFGISNPRQARTVATSADGVVVGSAIINLIEKNAYSKYLARRVGSFVSTLKKGIEGA